VALYFTLLFIYAVRLATRKVISAGDKVSAGKMFVLVLSQVMVGVLNITLAVPAWLTVIHLGLAVFLLLTVLKLNLSLQRRILAT
jgi:heme A synthase